MVMTIAWHVQKHGMGAVNGLQIHNERLTEKHTNKNIDVSKSNLNISDKLVVEKFGSTTYQQRIKSEVEKRVKRKVRSDAVVDVENSIQFGGDFKSLSPDKQTEVISTAYQFIVERFGGRENVIAGNIHFDETTPHAHLDMIPITADGRLSAKLMINRTSLKNTQGELLAYMQEKYPELGFERASEAERGFANGKSQEDYERLKKQADEAKELAAKQQNVKLNAKEQVIDAIAEAMPNATVPDETYNKRFEKSKDKEQFINDYGNSPQPVSTDHGKKQFNWFGLKTLYNHFNKILELKKKREKESYEKQQAQQQKEFETKQAQQQKEFETAQQELLRVQTENQESLDAIKLAKSQATEQVLALGKDKLADLRQEDVSNLLGGLTKLNEHSVEPHSVEQTRHREHEEEGRGMEL